VTITFEACLQGSSCIVIDDDRSAKIKMTCDATQIASVLQMVGLKGKTFIVSIEAGDA